MDISMVRAMLPKVPLMGKTALFHTFGLSEHSKHWDLRTELTVNVLRSFIVDSAVIPVSKIQKASRRDPGVKGRIWVSRVALPAPVDDDIRQVLFNAIEGMKAPEEIAGGFTKPELVSVEAEWTGYRAGATENSLELQISEEEKYKNMMSEVASPTTILYFHGGAYYLMDPATHRPATKKLAKITKGRCLSVRYRLAPQDPFPSALLDALVSYFNLLYPQAGSFHEPVDPNHIVFAGDSAGGNLSLVLLQTLLEIKRQGLKIRWNGEDREVPMPAGVATCSAWADITHSLPSCEGNRAFDYLPPLSGSRQSRPAPKCDIWPTDPPRTSLYAEDALLCHPLVSPLAAKSWEGSCPIFMGTGQELLTDEDKYIASKAASQGVPVVYEEYVTMPHCFALLLEALPASRRFFDSWGGFITQVVERPETIKTTGTVIHPKSLEEDVVDVRTVCDFTAEEVLSRMKMRVQRMSKRQSDPLAKL